VIDMVAVTGSRTRGADSVTARRPVYADGWSIGVADAGDMIE